MEEAVFESPTAVGQKKVVRESTKAFLRRVDTVKELVREGKTKVERENAPLRISDRAFHYAVVLADNLFLPTNKTDCEWQKKVLEILNEACVVLRERIAQEDSVLDEEEYVLRRALVEYKELVKQKDRHSKVWLQRVEREIEEASVKLQSILNRWTSVSMSSRILSPQVSNKLESFSRFLVNMLSSSEAELHGELPDLSQFLQQFGVLKDQLVGMVPSACMDALTVGYEHVAEVVSHLTNIPLPWLYTPAMPESRKKAMRKLHERIVDQDYVLDEIFQTLFHPDGFIFKIALGTSKRPRGSILLLGPSGVGKTEIARGIAENLLYDANRFIRIDMSEYAELHLVPSPCGSYIMFNDEMQQSSFGRLIEAVRERPYSLILFDKIELAHPSVLEILLKIVTDGEIIDGQGHTVVFSYTIVIMTSEVGAYQLGYSCACPRQSSRLMKKFKRDPERFYQTHKCVQKLRAVEEARSFFPPDLLNSLDNIFVLVPSRNYKAVARLLLRESARNFLRGDVVIYPSDAALCSALNISSSTKTIKYGNAIKRWIDDNVVQVLSNSRYGMEHKSPTVYVDSLVGTNELSFRFETSKRIVEEWFLDHFKVSLGKLRAMYRMEKEIVIMLLTMGKYHSHLMNGPVEFSDVKLLCMEVQKFLRCCYLSRYSLFSVHHRLKKDASSSMVADKYHVEKATKGLKNLQKILQESVIGHKNPSIGFIANAVSRTIDAPSVLPNRPFGSYLFLGLNTLGQIELIKGLAEHMKTTDGNTLLVTIDMQKPLYAGLLVEAVKKSPHSVLLFYRVESADCLSYSTLLKILENGMLTGSEGAVGDFRNATIVLTSDLGNINLLARLFGHSYLDCGKEDDTLQEEGRLRAELLCLMDEILFFDPYSYDQREIGRLSMEGPHFNEEGADQLLFSLFSIFRKSSDTVCLNNSVVNCLSGALERTGVN